MLSGLDVAQAKELTSFPATLLGEPLGLPAFLASLAAVHPSSRMNVHPPLPHAMVAGKKVVTGDKPELLVPVKRFVTEPALAQRGGVPGGGTSDGGERLSAVFPSGAHISIVIGAVAAFPGVLAGARTPPPSA